MSLSIVKYFNKALRSNTDILSATGGRIFPVCRNAKEEDEDKIPYIIMMPQSVTNDSGSKDESEGDVDTAIVTLEICAEDYAGLVELTEEVRACIKGNEELTDSTWNFELLGYDFAAQEVNYDPLKPCFYQRLVYTCYTININ